MWQGKRVFLVSDTKSFTNKLLQGGARKYVKGLLRLGHDAQVFSYNTAFLQASPIKRQLLGRRWCKRDVDDLLAKQICRYEPDVLFVKFCKGLDRETIARMREAAPSAPIAAIDADLWPELHEDRVRTAKELDFVLTTYTDKGAEAYKEAGVKHIFMPNVCDPDIEHRYDVSNKWTSDILFTGKERLPSGKYPTERLRYDLIKKVSEMPGSAVYGSFGKPWLGGMEYFYAISGARMALSINARSDIAMYHSDRLTQYLACGTLALAKRVPETERLFKDGVNLRYFDTEEEFTELVKWYLSHDKERGCIADEGMRYVHKEYNCEKIAGYMMDSVSRGGYSAPWNA
jgi:hypothetical protein